MALQRGKDGYVTAKPVIAKPGLRLGANSIAMERWRSNTIDSRFLRPD
jgi:hypothetical protein